MEEFGLDKPMWQQFFIYVGNVLQGDLGTSFAQYPASVNSLIGQALPWSLALHDPGHADRLGRRQHPRRGGRLQGRLGRPGAFVGSLFFSSIPPFALGIILLFSVAVKMGHPAGRRRVLLRPDAGVVPGVLR